MSANGPIAWTIVLVVWSGVCLAIWVEGLSLRKRETSAARWREFRIRSRTVWAGEVLWLVVAAGSWIAYLT